MAKKKYKCPHCNNSNQLILMGYSSGTFEKICPSCNSKLEITLKNDKTTKLSTHEGCISKGRHIIFFC